MKSRSKQSTTVSQRIPCIAFAVLASWLGACGPSVPAEEHAHEEAESKAEAPSEVTLTDQAIASNGIRLERVGKHDVRPMFRVPARIAFNAEGMAQVGSPVKGRIFEWRVKLGDEVGQDDVLVVIESLEMGEAQSDYLVKKSAALASAPQVAIAEGELERARALHEKTQGIALSEVQKREGELATARAVLRAARAAEEAASHKLILLGTTPAAVARLGETGVMDPRVFVRAPITGQVIERDAMLGELVGPDHAALLVLADTRRLSVSADVPESRLRDVVVGAHARVLLGLEQHHWCDGTVAFISPALDAATRSVRVRIDVHDQHPELRPGVFARAEIEAPLPEGATETSVLAVPEAAVHDIDGEPVVFVPVAGRAGTFAKRIVRIGTNVRGMIPVASGLAEGEEFVAAGGFVLKASFTASSAAHDH
jgi:cobalt-zinc-cadmium efflux system membrane fusion protein